MKTIEYDPSKYEVIKTIEFDNDLFQSVKFHTGNYGVVYAMPELDKYDVIAVTDEEAYVNLFLEFARNQTDVINKIHEKIDEVHLVVTLNKEQSEVFEQMISKDESNDLIERLKIANEIIEMREANRFDSFPVLSYILVVCIILNLAAA